MNPIREEVDLGDQKKAFKGKTIKIKKMVKKETGSFTLKDTYIEANDTLNTSKNEATGLYPMADDLQSIPDKVLPPDSAIQAIPDNLVQQPPTDAYNKLNFSKPSEPRPPREVRA